MQPIYGLSLFISVNTLLAHLQRTMPPHVQVSFLWQWLKKIYYVPAHVCVYGGGGVGTQLLFTIWRRTSSSDEGMCTNGTEAGTVRKNMCTWRINAMPYNADVCDAQPLPTILRCHPLLHVCCMIKLPNSTVKAWTYTAAVYCKRTQYRQQCLCCCQLCLWRSCHSKLTNIYSILVIYNG